MKKILIISPGQFGTHVGTYNYCLFLAKSYEVTYLGIYEDRPLVESEDVNVFHLKMISNPISRKINFLYRLSKHLASFKYDIVYLNYFLGSSFVRFLVKEKVVIDVRTTYISKNAYKRNLFNFLLSIEVRMFQNITVISKGVLEYLKLPKRSHIIPLGSPSFQDFNKNFNDFNILYVGTFNNRCVDKAIYGIGRFIEQFSSKVNIKFDLIGYGTDEELENIRDAISKTNCSENIRYLGTIRYPSLKEYFQEYNIGVSFIPITDFFMFQPPTKTFEYLMSGMVVLATSTDSNSAVIKPENGVLIDDSSEGVYDGLCRILNNRHAYKSLEIQNDSRKYSWDNIINNNLIPYLNGIK